MVVKLVGNRLNKDESNQHKKWHLRLYILEQTPKSMAAFANIEAICKKYLKGQYVCEVIDIQKKPEMARSDHVIAIPTLIRMLPHPVKTIVGDLSSMDKLLAELEIPLHCQ